jgi:Erv1 / Alr family
MFPTRNTRSDLMNIFNKVPCGTCATHYRELIETTPAPEDDEKLFSWSVQMHNEVNAKLSRPPMAEDIARQVYGIIE